MRSNYDARQGGRGALPGFVRVVVNAADLWRAGRAAGVGAGTPAHERSDRPAAAADRAWRNRARL
ncbi:MAG: hypothetical protein IPP13_24805 [Kouleothrix sp.]|nr:hypothetical protein [Kouleothrix sp.]